MTLWHFLKYVPHRQWVFSIPKRLRIYFMFDRKLLSKLSQCVWKVLSVYLKHAVSDEDADPGAKILILTTKPASAIWKVIVCVNGCFNMLC